MSLVGHIVKKDFRRMWAPLGLWAFVLLAKNRVGTLALAHDGANFDRWTALAIATGVLLGLDIFVNVVLVAVLVHEDTLVGTRMFWATRPVGGARLLAAKLISIVLMFGLLPVLAALPWWLANDYGPPEIARAAFATLDWQALTVLPALVLAVLTENPLRFLGWLLSLAVAVASCMLIFSLLHVRETSFGVPFGLTKTRLFVGSVVAIAGCAGAIAGQFLTRRLARSLVTLAGTAVAMLLVRYGWPWDWSAPPGQTGPVFADAAAITVAADWTEIHPPSDSSGQWLTASYLVRGVPEDLGIAGRAEHIFHFSRGDDGVRNSPLVAAWPGRAEWLALGLPAGKNDAVTQAWLHSGKQQPENWTKADARQLRVQYDLTLADVARLREDAPRYLGRLQIALERPERNFELPLHEGRQWENAGDSVRIAAVDWREGELSVAVIESLAAGENYPHLRPGLTAGLLIPPGFDRRGYALVNRARGEAVKLWPKQQARSLLVGTQEVTWRMFSCSLPRDADERLSAPPRWLEGAALAGVRYRDAGTVEREVTIAHFTMVETKEPPQ